MENLVTFGELPRYAPAVENEPENFRAIQEADTILIDELEESYAHPACFSEWAEDRSQDIDHYFALCRRLNAEVNSGETDRDYATDILRSEAKTVIELYEEDYCGEWESVGEWAKDIAVSLGHVSRDALYNWPFNSVDWTEAGEELEGDGYIIKDTVAGTVVVVGPM